MYEIFKVFLEWSKIILNQVSFTVQPINHPQDKFSSLKNWRSPSKSPPLFTLCVAHGRSKHMSRLFCQNYPLFLLKIITFHKFLSIGQGCQHLGPLRWFLVMLPMLQLLLVIQVEIVLTISYNFHAREIFCYTLVLENPLKVFCWSTKGN